VSKYKHTNFLQINREALHDNCDLSWRAKWLYVVLSELEHRFTGTKTDFFFRSQQDLEKDTGMQAKTNRKYREELVKKGWLQTWNMHRKDPETGKLSYKHTTAYRLLK